jgi:uncharacterized membrane protein YhfC
VEQLFVVISLGCFFAGFIIFLQSINNAFNKTFLWGIACLLFPIGSYFYYKRFFKQEKKNAIYLSTFLGVGAAAFIIAKIIAMI